MRTIKILLLVFLLCLVSVTPSLSKMTPLYDVVDYGNGLLWIRVDRYEAMRLDRLVATLDEWLGDNPEKVIISVNKQIFDSELGGRRYKIYKGKGERGWLVIYYDAGRVEE